MPKRPPKKLLDVQTGKLITTPKGYRHRVMVGIPVTGLVRYEWVMGRYGQVIPCNWSQVDCLQFYHTWSPIGFQVADARNIIVRHAVEGGFDWLFFIDHDTILPHTTILKWNDYMLKGDIPVFCGLYFTKSVPSEPLIYRGRGNSYYNKWKLGDKVWVDGIPMGCTVINVKIFKAMWEDCEQYKMADGQVVRRIFNTPAQSYWDDKRKSWFNNTGTEDLDWCTRVINGKYITKAGWPEIGKKKYPFLVDTNIFCRHIDNDGVQYPSRGEENEFIKTL